MNEIAILGCGSIGKRWLSNLQELGVSPLFVYDPDPDAREAAATLGALPLADLDELQTLRPEIVFVCTPSQQHLEGALAAVRSGAHLFIEKPISHSLDGLEELACTIRENHCIDLVGCNMRFHPGPRELKRRLEAGEIGEVMSARLHVGSYLPRWRPQQDYRASYSASPDWGGAILDCIHEIDLALWLLGEAALRAAVTRPARSLGLETDGLAELLLEHTDGALSSIHLNFVQRNYHRSIELIGESGTLFWDYTAGTVERYDEEGRLADRTPQEEGWQPNRMYQDELSYFLSRIRRREPTFNGVEAAARTLKIALQARRLGAARSLSRRSGHPLKVRSFAEINPSEIFSEP